MGRKFGQRTNKTQVVEFIDPVKFHECHKRDRQDIRYVSALTEERVEIHYKHQVEDDPVSPNLNVFVACFTTCWARLRLYEAFDLSKERVVYGDTDSIVYIHRPGLPDPLLGDYLGDFKDELSNGDYIVEFASGGPKNYGYVTAKGKKKCKARGLSLNSEGSRQMNYQVLRQNVLDDIQNPLEEGARHTNVTKTHHIVRDAKQRAIETTRQVKKYQLVYNIRMVDPTTFQTYPYGYFRYTPEDEKMAELLCEL